MGTLVSRFLVMVIAASLLIAAPAIAQQQLKLPDVPNPMVVAAPEIQLAEKIPSVGCQRVAAQIGVMGENELAVGTTPNVDLDGVGHGGRCQQPTECVVRETGGPAPMTDDR